MGWIEHSIQEIVSFLRNEITINTEVLRHSPSGGLVYEKSSGRERYLHAVHEKAPNSRGYRYKRRLVTMDSPTLCGLADREYSRIALQILQYDLKMLETVLQRLRPYTPENIRVSMRQAYRSLPDDCFRMIRQPKEALSRQFAWARAPFNQSTYKPEEKIHTTSRGLHTRTRAELLIAEMLYRFNIPFRYEQVLPIGKYDFAPDFTFLDKDGNEFYLEYCGMMEDIFYRERQIWKRGVYESAGITEWENMIYIYDLGESVDMRKVEAVIRGVILPRMLG